MATTDQILDWDGLGQRRIGFRFDLLDRSLAKIGEIKPDRSKPPSLDNNTTRPIKRTLRNFRLYERQLSEVNMLTDLVQPNVVLENGDSLPWGVFTFVDDPTMIRSSGSVVTAQLVDQCQDLNQPWPWTLSYAPGLHVGILMALIFEECGFAKGQYAIDQFPNLISTPIAWPAGTSLLKVMNDLCALVGAYQVYFDNQGIGRIRLIEDLETAPITVKYQAGAKGNMLTDSILFSSARLTAANRYVVVDTGATDAPITGIYDVPDSAPNSYKTIGRRRVRFISEQGLANPQAAVQRARAGYLQDSLDYQWGSFAGAIDPRHDTYNVLDVLGDRYREQGWGPVALTPGASVAHTIRRVYSTGAS